MWNINSCLRNRYFIKWPYQKGSLILEVSDDSYLNVEMTVKSVVFEKAAPKHLDAILQWLEEPYVKEFWDNSPEHREDILIFMKGRKEASPYWNGIFTYWVGLMHDEPYCLLMTSEILSTESDLPEIWKAHLSKKGKTYGLDFMIGNTKYLNQGLGAPTLIAFTQMIQTTIDRSIDTFLIDPADSNPRAVHVYAKAGFKQVATFHRDFGDQKQLKHILMVRQMPSTKG